jgi:hypothetical protein
MGVLTAKEQMTLVTRLAPLNELLQFDEVWTQAVEDRAREADAATVRGLADRMDTLVADAADTADYLSDLFRANEDLVREACEMISSSDLLSAEQQDAWRALVDEASGPLEFVTDAMQTVKRRAPEERRQIKEKADGFERQGGAEGDVSAAFMCGLTVGLAVGSAIGGVWKLAFVSGIVAGAACAEA